MPSFWSSMSEVAARPKTTSARGFAFSARSLAVTMPVEFADPADVDAGIGRLEGRLVALELVGLDRGVDRDLLGTSNRERRRGEHGRDGKASRHGVPP